MNPNESTEIISILGLGYVGLPLALRFAEIFPFTKGFDISEERIKDLQSHKDRNHEVSANSLAQSTLTLTNRMDDLRGSTVFIVTVPTPVSFSKLPDLSCVNQAANLIGTVMRGTESIPLVVLESTVFPGVTETVFGKIIENVSGKVAGEGFHLGYSPERINPGDNVHCLHNMVKVVAGVDNQSLARMTSIYEGIVGDVFQASCIQVAEAAKVVENAQRDINIAYMNELSRIFDLAGIDFGEVLAAAGTKWNFLKFTPGLVGGHCIGVDPYYLASFASSLGYHPEVVLAGRRVNDSMGSYIAQRVLKELVELGVSGLPRIGIFGLTYKENVADFRNSQALAIVSELKSFGVAPMVCDPFLDQFPGPHTIAGCALDDPFLKDLHAIIVAVPHGIFYTQADALFQKLLPGGLVFDVKGTLRKFASIYCSRYCTL